MGSIEVLTASASDYASSIGKSLKEYDLRGVTGVVDVLPFNTLPEYLHNHVPAGTEVVTDLRFTLASGKPEKVDFGELSSILISGTALIPKKAQSSR